MLHHLTRLLADPPPSLVFEISEGGVAMARMGTKSRLPESIAFRPLAPGAIDPSPIRENVHDAAELDRALAEALAEAGGPRKKKDAALLLPDNCARLTVLDFENLPGDSKERLSLLRWRLKKAVPFDVEAAAIAYQVQRAPVGKAGPAPFSVLVTVSPAEVIGQYEAAIRRLGLTPGFVSTSAASSLNLVVEHGVTMLAKLSGPILTLVVIDRGVVRLVRTLPTAPAPQALSEDTWREMAADLYPTFVYVADNLGSPVSRLVLAGFGDSLRTAIDVFRRELGCEPQALAAPQGVTDAHNTGIWGYLSEN